jgi:hypothetical protein
MCNIKNLHAFLVTSQVKFAHIAALVRLGMAARISSHEQPTLEIIGRLNCLAFRAHRSFELQGTRGISVSYYGFGRA